MSNNHPPMPTQFPIQCFLLTPTGEARVYLRRYNSNVCAASGMGYHDADTCIGVFAESKEEDGEFSGGHVPYSDPRWPLRCACGYVFTDEDPQDRRVRSSHSLYTRSDTGEVVTLREAPHGAMWFADWMKSTGGEWEGSDGHCLVVKVPLNHNWQVDGRASNCDSPCAHCSAPYHAHAGGLCKPLAQGEEYDQKKHYYKDARPHKCWVRHGEAPNITVDKAGVTCGAGAGSILTREWHGFLRNGQLTL